MGISPARKAAFDTLLRIQIDKSFSSVLLPIYEEKLSSADRALCHELVLGVLRRQMLLDRFADLFTKGRKLDLEVRLALWLGLFQILYLARVPHYAVVNDSVALVVRAKKSSAKGLVNAVLRKVTSETPKLSFDDETERISVKTSHPRWLIEKWTAQFGVARAEKIAAANNQLPKLSFRRTLKATNTLPIIKYRQSQFVRDGFIADSFDADLKRLAENGEIYFQDEASQMVAAAVDISEGGKFLDVCAAPGGKTGAIATRFAPNNGEPQKRLFVAGDLHPQRVQFLRENLLKQGIQFINVVQYNAAHSLPFASEIFVSVLVDAPCSGTGTIRHNPEIRYFVQPEDFAGLQRTQLAILTNASKLLKPGGTLVYLTCSLEREENESVCEMFLNERKDFTIVKPNVPDRFIATDGFAHTFPDRDDMDGFFIAVLRRK
ncbi:MAG TPA: 16S rRNA (cytosine(967)-C(5))-methyltransferase RsmB [Pyrinomonadaceae bacterium]|nr:16S rRNA (cytosine(967)-C(5))-methyltransferase RsmB [Pyrinomonadaceae bacterium]